MSSRWIHPSQRRLRTWLETGMPASVGQHVERCEHCADRLERIDQELRAGRSAATRPLDEGLSTLFDVPTDLGERVVRGLERRAKAEQEIVLLAGLFAVGIDTARLLVVPGDWPDDATVNRSRSADREERDESMG